MFIPSGTQGESFGQVLRPSCVCLHLCVWDCLIRACKKWFRFSHFCPRFLNLARRLLKCLNKSWKSFGAVVSHQSANKDRDKTCMWPKMHRIQRHTQTVRDEFYVCSAARPRCMLHTHSPDTLLGTLVAWLGLIIQSADHVAAVQCI